MRRLTGAVLILAASFLLRQSLLASTARRKRTLRSLADALTAIEYSVRLTLAPLPVLLREAHVSGEVRRLFDRVAAALACGEPLESAWRDAVRELPLSAREREMAASLGSALGGEEKASAPRLRRHRGRLPVWNARLPKKTGSARRSRPPSALAAGRF